MNNDQVNEKENKRNEKENKRNERENKRVWQLYPLVAILAGSLSFVASLTTIVFHHLQETELSNLWEWLQDKDVVNIITTLVTALIGTAIGVYFGQKSHKSK